jgi:hypothetical protein
MSSAGNALATDCPRGYAFYYGDSGPLDREGLISGPHIGGDPRELVGAFARGNAAANANHHERVTDQRRQKLTRSIGDRFRRGLACSGLAADTEGHCP